MTLRNTSSMIVWAFFHRTCPFWKKKIPDVLNQNQKIQLPLNLQINFWGPAPRWHFRKTRCFFLVVLVTSSGVFVCCCFGPSSWDSTSNPWKFLLAQFLLGKRRGLRPILWVVKTKIPQVFGEVAKWPWIFCSLQGLPRLWMCAFSNASAIWSS